MNKPEKTITIDPRIFISPPYIKCPKCGKKEFGVLGIGVGYTRRCRACWHTEGFDLPKLNRKIVYLDQFIISNMMKAINPHVEVKSGSDLSFYRELFEKLDRLVKLQLVLCPSSSTHRLESLVDADYAALKQMGEHLSHNTSFYTNDTIQRFQVINDFRRWLGLETKEININRIVYGRLEDWLDRLYISVDISGGETDLVDRIKAGRSKTSDALLPIYSRWQSEKGKTFKDWQQEELAAAGKVYWQAALARSERVQLGHYESVEDLLPSQQEITFIQMHELVLLAGYTGADSISKIQEYLSTEIRNVLHVKISASLYASIARDASLGRKKPINHGDLNDIDFISTLAPYCDALFIDKAFQSRLHTEPLKSELGLSSKIYSLNSKAEFMAYLEVIESSMSDKHLRLVNEVYGDWYNRPYTEMYKK